MALLHFIIPFGVLIIITVLLRKPLWLAALISYLISVGMQWYDGMELHKIGLGITMASFTAVEISLILTGAIFFLHFLSQNGDIEKINNGLQSLTTNRSIQIILLAWLFGSFIEGGAGFGTPALIIAPLLAAIGVPLTLAVAIPLLANTTAVVFGAVGTPIKIGLGTIPYTNVVTTTALINLVSGFIVPVMLVLLYKKFQKKAPLQDNFNYIPFAVWAGFALTFPSFLLSFTGPEFPSILGGLFGLLIILITLKAGFLLPKSNHQEVDIIGFFKAFLPYLGLSALLLAARFVFGAQHLLLEIGEGVYKKFFYFQPGMAFLTMPFILLFLSKKYKSHTLAVSFKEALKAVPRPAAAILFIAGISQNLSISEAAFLAPLLAGLPDYLILFLTPFFGALGSFAAGSATVSVLLFGNEVNITALTAGMDNTLPLSLLLIGSGIGNALALQNIAVVQAAIQTHGKEKELLKILIIPCLLYMALAGMVGMVFYWL
jgi:lactate permease